MQKISYNEESKVFLFDLETESLSLTSSRPWQIAGVELIGLKPKKFTNENIRWTDFNISRGAAAITRFDYGNYNRIAKDPRYVWNLVKDYFLDDSWTLAFHNGLCFDNLVMKTWLEEIGEWYGFEKLKGRLLDSRALLSAYKNQIKPDFDNFEGWQYKQINDRRRGVKTSLAELCKEFGIDYDKSKAHDALYDIEVNAQGLEKLCYHMGI